MSKHHYPNPGEFRQLIGALLGPEAAFFRVILVYSAAISLLSLAIPISVQLLIDSVANTGLISAIITIGLILFALLLVSGVLYALRAWSMELFNRRLYSRLSSEIAMTGLLVRTGYFEQEERAALFNRYFDIMTIKKNIPYLLGSGFTLLFQSIIGFVVVSLYHIYFLVFSIVLIVVIWAVWKIWGWKATVTAFRLSEAKHEAAAWLQGLAINNGFFKATRHHSYALEITDRKIHQHLDEQQGHFRHSFSQLLSFLFLYAFASAALLSVGGWLVLQGQLTLGQLVSAELIMSAIFYGLPQLAGYLDYYYDVCAAVEELSRFGNVEIEKVGTEKPVDFADRQALVFQKVGCESPQGKCRFDFTVPANSFVHVKPGDGGLVSLLASLLKQQQIPESGSITYGKADLLSCNLMELRQAVVVLDRQTLLSVTIRDYLKLAALNVGSNEIYQALAAVNLNEEIAQFKNGLDTCLSHSGYPLSLDQALRLKLAFVLLGSARIVVLGQIYDVLEKTILEGFWTQFSSARGGILLYCTKRQIPELTALVLELDSQSQTLIKV